MKWPRIFGPLFGAALLACLVTLIRHYYHKHVEETCQQPELSVAEEMLVLARSYFKPEHLANGLTRAQFDGLAERALDLRASRGATLILQVIQGHLYVDLAGWQTPYPWDRQRAQFLLAQLESVLKRHPLPDFEAILNTHDCPLRGDGSSNAAPYLSITKCETVSSIPVPQWYRARDGAFAGWNRRMDQAFLEANEVGWAAKAPKAVFRGAIRRSSLQLHEGRLRFIDIDPGNWREASRTKLCHLAHLHPHCLDVGVTREAPSSPHQEAILKSMDWQPVARLSMAEQAQRFRYIVYMEGACGWADRLKSLLATGAVILMQETPCGEFFARLLVPWRHYIPVRNDLEDLAEQIRWAEANQEEAQEIGANAAEFARRYLSQEAWVAYIEAVFSLYASLPRYPIVRGPRAQRYRQDLLEESGV